MEEWSRRQMMVRMSRREIDGGMKQKDTQDHGA